MSDVPKKILVAEDVKPLAFAMERKLTHAGYEVKVVPNGQVAIDTLETESFDLLITDLIMPKVDGFEVLAEIKKKNIEVKSIVTTNLSQEEGAKKAKDLGALDYFVKSDTSITKLVEKVKKALGDD